MALIGARWNCEARGRARFRCPSCAGSRDCRRTALRRRLTLFGRPLLPIGPPEVYLTCEVCDHAYEAAVADDGDSANAAGVRRPLATDDGVAEDERALLALASAVIFSDSAVRRSEKSAAFDVIARYTGRELPGGHVDGLLRRARARWGEPLDRLARLPWLVPETVRLRIVRAAYEICAADGELHPQETRFLDRVGAALELTPRQVRHVLREARRAVPRTPGGRA